MRWIIEDDEMDVNEEVTLLIEEYPDLYSLPEIKAIWQNVCNRYNHYVNEVKLIESSVSMFDLDV